MKKKGLEILEKVISFGDKNSPAILAGLAVVGLIATGAAAYKAGIKAHDILEKRKKDMEYVKINDKEAKRAVNKETAKALLPVIAPVVVMGTATAACMIGSTSISNRRIAVVSAAYSLSERTVKDLNAKMTETLGEKKTRAIKDSISKDRLDANSIPAEDKIIITGDGDVLCMDSYSGRFFKSNAEKIGQAVNKLSSDCMVDMYVSLNDFYEAINAPGLRRIPMGEDLGWNLDDTINGRLPITVTAQLTEDSRPCLCIDYDISLRSDFRNLR